VTATLGSVLLRAVATRWRACEILLDTGFITGHGQTIGMEIAQIEFEVAGDLAHWRAEIPGKVSAAAQALTGPTTPKGKRVQTMYPPGSETGGEVATWGRATSNRVDAMGVKWDATGKSSKHIPFDWSGPG